MLAVRWNCRPNDIAVAAAVALVTGIAGGAMVAPFVAVAPAARAHEQDSRLEIEVRDALLASLTARHRDDPGAIVMPKITDLTVTPSGDHVVARYAMRAVPMLSGATVEAPASRLAVLRRSGDQWQVVADGSFASPAD